MIEKSWCIVLDANRKLRLLWSRFQHQFIRWSLCSFESKIC